MTTPTFDPNDARLTAYALGELDESDRAELEQLLVASPALREELVEIQSLTGLLRDELATEPSPKLTAEQRQLLAKQIAESRPALPTAAAPAPTFQRRRLRRWAIIGAEVAVASVAIALVPFWLSPGDQRTSRSTVAKDSRTRTAQPSTVGWENMSGSTSTQPEPATEGEWIHAAAGSSVKGEPVGNFRASIGRGSEQDDDELRAVVPQDSKSDSSLVHDPSSRDTNEQLSKRASPVPSQPSLVAGNPGEGGNASGKSGSGQISKLLSDRESTREKLDMTERNFGDSRKGNPSGDSSGPHSTLLRSRSEGVKNLESKPGQSDALSRLTVSNSSRPNASESRSDPTRHYLLDMFDAPGAEAYEAPAENQFVTPAQQPLSTFSIDVDSASYSNVRRFLTQGQLPPSDAVRIEELVNYFGYDYPQPKDGQPFSVTADAAPCPWRREHCLARIGLKAKDIDKAKRPPTNLVFLLDVSGSMQPANKLPLVKQAMTMLVEELNERDRIAIVTYAGDAGLKLASTPGNDQVQIMQAIQALQAGGSTNGAAGINLAYEEALRHFNGEGENRVILCTDGDFNVGVSSDDQLVQLIQQQAKSKVFLSIFGFGMGNLKDAKLEKLADKGNGHYGYIDDLKEARRVFNEELVGTLYTVAKDVKIQVEFNPLTVGAYRLIGYENRALAARDFNDDTKDAGEIGAGHTVTALYEIVPRGQWPKTQAVDALKYTATQNEPPAAVAPPKANVPADVADDLFTVKLRYKQPTADTSVKTIDYVVDDIAGKKDVTPSADMLWAASVAAFGMHLKHSPHVGTWALNDVLETAQGAKGRDANGRRAEFLDLIQAAHRLKAQSPQNPSDRPASPTTTNR